MFIIIIVIIKLLDQIRLSKQELEQDELEHHY
jgi:hypothetical protein